MSVTTGSISVPGAATSLRHPPNLVKQGIYEISSTQNNMLGSRLELGERTFRYGYAGGVALAAGKMCEGPAPSSDHLKCVLAAAAAVGDMRIKITLGGSTVAAANLYAEGWLNLDNGAAGAFQTYKIKGHAAIGAGGTGYINLFDPINVALTTSMYATLTVNPYRATVVAPAATPQAQVPVGVPLVAVTPNYYYWSQTGGPCGVLLGAGPPAISDPLMTSAATAGALITYAVTAGRTVVGTLMRAEAAADYGLVWLNIY